MWWSPISEYCFKTPSNLKGPHKHGLVGKRTAVKGSEADFRGVCLARSSWDFATPFREKNNPINKEHIKESGGRRSVCLGSAPGTVWG